MVAAVMPNLREVSKLNAKLSELVSELFGPLPLNLLCDFGFSSSVFDIGCF